MRDANQDERAMDRRYRYSKHENQRWAGRDRHYGTGERTGPEMGTSDHSRQDGANHGAEKQQHQGWGYARDYNRGGPEYGLDDDEFGRRGGQPAIQQRYMPKGYSRSDERIHDDVCERLSRSGMDVSEVSVDVSDGHVSLEGTVTERRFKHAIENIADDCLGVKDIDNRIRVQQPSRASGRSDEATGENAGKTATTEESINAGSATLAREDENSASQRQQ